MSENCTHNCETCGESCPSREGGFPKEQLKEGCSVKKVIGIVSGKGGVGKSMVTSLLSVILNRRGYHTAILEMCIRDRRRPLPRSSRPAPMGRPFSEKAVWLRP